jgi:hypothetical protein
MEAAAAIGPSIWTAMDGCETPLTWATPRKCFVLLRHPFVYRIAEDGLATTDDHSGRMRNMSASRPAQVRGHRNASKVHTFTRSTDPSPWGAEPHIGGFQGVSPQVNRVGGTGFEPVTSSV